MGTLLHQWDRGFPHVSSGEQITKVLFTQFTFKMLLLFLVFTTFLGPGVCKQDDASLLFGRLFNNTSSTAKVIQL
jgi:hypothetical protein